MWISPSAAVSVGSRKSCAYQSLQPSPIAPACGEFNAPAPSASLISRFVSPCVYSW